LIVGIVFLFERQSPLVAFKAQKAVTCLFPEHVRQSAQATALLIILILGTF
jgi:hypothetical protein